MSPKSSLDGIGEVLEISSRNPLSTALGNGDDAIQVRQDLIELDVITRPWDWQLRYYSPNFQTTNASTEV
ncbi:hypothetical protein PABG_03181 [Paracoccidioides brasiliensis Pb03]|nr:hypothetical protein PABG_03181 [Paracoccidioides brasiliensis Pb03]